MTGQRGRLGLDGPAWGILVMLSASHLINDIMQSMLPAIYPLLEEEFSLKYWQIGALTLAYQGTSSVFQPLMGELTDRRPMPRSLPFGMGVSFAGLWLLALGQSFTLVLIGAALIGIGSAIFHPEASRTARTASGGRFGTAQSLFQVGGNTGTALGSMLALLIVVPFGRPAVLVFSLLAAIGAMLLWRVSSWSDGHRRNTAKSGPPITWPKGGRREAGIIAVLLGVIFSKYIYQTSLTSFLTLYSIERFGVSKQASLVLLTLYLVGMAAGVLLGGMIADRVGTKTVIWVSVLGVLPFTLALPHAGYAASCVLVVMIGLIIASSFPAAIVYAQELLPGRAGMIAGLFFGFAFGVAGVAAVLLGLVADAYGIEFVYRLCAWLPAAGVIAIFLPASPELSRP